MATDAKTLRRTNEEAGTRARLKNLPTSAYKVREVLDLIRGERVGKAREILAYCQRGPAVPIAKLLNSAVANAETNDSQDADELFVSSCFADEGVTAKRWRPRARGRAGRIRKRSSHVTIIVSRLPEETLVRLESDQNRDDSRARRVAGSRADRVAASKKNVPSATESDSTSETAREATETEEEARDIKAESATVAETNTETKAETTTTNDVKDEAMGEKK